MMILESYVSNKKYICSGGKIYIFLCLVVGSRLSARVRMGESFYFCEISSRFYVVTT